MRISRHAGLRAIGGAAAYVLALHTMLFGLAATPSLRAAATGSLAVELCLSGGPAGARAALVVLRNGRIVLLEVDAALESKGGLESARRGRGRMYSPVLEGLRYGR